jgi:hypothetical protein
MGRARSAFWFLHRHLASADHRWLASHVRPVGSPHHLMVRCAEFTNALLTNPASEAERGEG